MVTSDRRFAAHIRQQFEYTLVEPNLPYESGTMIVMRASTDFELIAVNEIGNELTNSTQAMSEGEIFIRTHEHLWCIGDSKKVALK